MGEGMSTKRPPGSGPESVCRSVEERRQGGNRVRPTAEKPTAAPILSRPGGEWHKRWRRVSHRKEERLLQQNGTWGNMSAATACERSPAVYGDAGGPTRNISGTKEDRMDLPSEDCKEVLIGDTPPPAKSGPAQVEKRCEWSSLDVWLEPGTQDGSQPLSKGTQTEAALSDHEEQPSFQSGRDCDSVYMQELAESSEKVIQQGLKAFFGFLTILVNIPTLFVLELIHFLGKSVFQALVVGLITAVGEEILEPLLAAFFNSILQPLLIFLLNILCSIRNLSYPAVDLLKAVCLQVAVVLRAFRLVEITNHPKNAVAEQV